jgi:hypothetical protein
MFDQIERSIERWAKVVPAWVAPALFRMALSAFGIALILMGAKELKLKGRSEIVGAVFQIALGLAILWGAAFGSLQ